MNVTCYSANVCGSIKEIREATSGKEAAGRTAAKNCRKNQVTVIRFLFSRPDSGDVWRTTSQRHKLKQLNFSFWDKKDSLLAPSEQLLFRQTANVLLGQNKGHSIGNPRCCWSSFDHLDNGCAPKVEMFFKKSFIEVACAFRQRIDVGCSANLLYFAITRRHITTHDPKHKRFTRARSS